MTHGPHEYLAGYQPGQILVDGCGECEARSALPDHGLCSLDPARFAWAWKRAAVLNLSGLEGVSATERPLLNMLWGVQVQLERWNIPLGNLPGKDMHLVPF